MEEEELRPVGAGEEVVGGLEFVSEAIAVWVGGTGAVNRAVLGGRVVAFQTGSIGNEGAGT